MEKRIFSLFDNNGNLLLFNETNKGFGKNPPEIMEREVTAKDLIWLFLAVIILQIIILYEVI